MFTQWSLNMFRLLWMLSIFGIHSKPRFTISHINPKINKICFGDQQYYYDHPTWTIQINVTMTEADIKGKIDYLHFAVVNPVTNFNEFCEVNFVFHPRTHQYDRSFIYCPKTSPRLPRLDSTDDHRCYCTSTGNSSTVIWYNVIYERMAELSENGTLLFISSPFTIHKEILPVPILAQTCFNFRSSKLVSNGIETKGTINEGEIWYARGYLNIANVDKPKYTSVVQVEKGSKPFCTIDIRKCYPTGRWTGDINCYCFNKTDEDQFTNYVLKINARAQWTQSQRLLTAKLKSKTGCHMETVTATIGTLPTIIDQGHRPTTKTISQATTLPTPPEQSTTKTQGATTEQSTTKSEWTTTTQSSTKAKKQASYIWLIVPSCLVFFCSCAVLWYFYIYKKTRSTSENRGKQTTEDSFDSRFKDIETKEREITRHLSVSSKSNVYADQLRASIFSKKSSSENSPTASLASKLENEELSSVIWWGQPNYQH